MKGKPKFKYGDEVTFDITYEGKLVTKKGTVYIIDAYGTWEDPSDVSYDIMVPNDVHKASFYNSETQQYEVKETIGDCLYKHIREDGVREATN